jgi:hypothetical protein
MPITASPEPAQSLIASEWAEVTRMNGPYPALGDSSPLADHRQG